MLIQSATYQRKLEVDRDERLLRERRATLACIYFSLDPAVFAPVSITSVATCDEDVVTL